MKYVFPPFSKKKIASLLAERPFEDLTALKTIEQFFLKKRGYVFTMPQPNEPVILLLSGGLDSVVLWAILMKHYHLKVYPLVLLPGKWGALSGAARAVRFYARWYQKKFPRYFQEPFFISHHDTSQRILQKIGTPATVHANYLLKHLALDDEVMTAPTTGLMAQFAFLAHDYAQLLLAQKGIRVSTFLCAVTPSDGGFIQAQSLTSLRAAMFDLCATTNDFALQFTALAVEKNLGFFHPKTDFLRWAIAQGLPLSHTHSCNRFSLLHCGRCVSCWSRQEMLKKAGALDNTAYLHSYLTRLGISFLMN